MADMIADVYSIKEPVSKRVFDFILSLVGLVLSSWVWALIWIAIYFEDGAPCLIRQNRIGKNGVIFKVLKFRSMRKASLSETINIQARADDPRITKVGRFLRKTALDELPQLINILIGEMSFVGPRALLPAEIEVENDCNSVDITKIPGYAERILIKPGLTGIAQIFAPRDVSRRRKFRYDLIYLKKMNLLFDIKLILLSFLITFKGTWDKKGRKLTMLK